MFRVENNVPDVYISQSRDFQLLARLYDLVIQSSRFSIDSLADVSDTKRCNSYLLPLLANKVGLFTELKIPDKQYRAIISGFPHIIKYKGSIHGIELILDLFGRAFNIGFGIDKSNIDNSVLTIVVSERFPDVKLLYSLIEYVAPSGILIKYEQSASASMSNDYRYFDDVTITPVNEIRDDANAIISNEETYDSLVGFAEISGATLNKDKEDDNSVGGEA